MSRWILGALLGIAAPASALDLSWISGSWCGGARHGGVQETWSDTSGGLILGLNKNVRDGKPTEFEFLRVEWKGEEATYISQPNGAPPTPFKMVEAGEGYALFANPAHDFPKRIGYRRRGDKLEAWIDDGTDQGEPMLWQFRRCPSPAK